MGTHSVWTADYAAINEIIRRFEAANGMTTEVFLSRYRSGTIESAHLAALWSALAKLQEHLRPETVDVPLRHERLLLEA